MRQFLTRALPAVLLLSCPPAGAEDLVAIYRLALEQDVELKIAEADYRAALETLPIAKSGRLPQITLSADTSRRETDNSETGDDTFDSTGYTLSLTQSLYDTDLAADIGAAEASTEAERARFEAAQQNLALRVAETYFDILAAQDNVDFAYAERTAIARQLEQAQKRFEVGLIAITDVHEAQARFDSAEAQAILAENLLENAYQALAVITGDAAIRELAKLGDDLRLVVPEPADARAWVDFALANNRELAAARENLNAARFARRKAARGRYPTVDLVASYADQDTENNILGEFQQDDFSVGIELQIPLYTGGRIGSEQAQAEARLQSARNTTLLQSRLASQQARTSYLDVVSGISQVKALAQALESSNIALEATQAGFEVGTRTSVDVLVSLRETYRAQRDYASARYDYLVNTLRLKQAAGLLEAGDLAQINRYLVSP